MSRSQSPGRANSQRSRRSECSKSGGEKQDTTAIPSVSAGEGDDPFVVDWDGPLDPANPKNWSPRRKWWTLSVLSLITLLTPLASSIFAPGVPQVDREFNNSNPTLSTLMVSVYLFGYAVGPLVIAPLSELYGRLPVYHICSLLFIVWTIACALATDLGMLIVFRFLAGCFGIAPLTNGAGTIADIMDSSQRGRAMSIWQLGPLLGPIIGPVAGGFLAEYVGWRWIFWTLAIASGVCTVLSFVVFQETHAPTLLERKASRLRKRTGDHSYRSKMSTDETPRTKFVKALVRPTKLLTCSLICMLMSIFNGVVYAIMYLMFTTYTFVFEDMYGFSEGIVGLVYIGIGIGLLLGLALIAAFSDPIVKHLGHKHNGGELKPEYRLPLAILLGPAIPVGLFLYGWTAQYQIQWAVPLLGTLIVGIGLIAVFTCISIYLVDTFTEYAASAIAANTILRSVLAGVFPLFGLQLYDALGLGWGNSLLAFIALALCPIPWLFYIYGERLRNHPRWQVKL